MKSNFYQVRDFHIKFGLQVHDKPSLPPLDTFRDRKRFMQEELNEWVEASIEGDLEKSLDSLIDLIYVAIGTAEMQGFSPELFEEAWNRVHKANMAKERTKTPGGHKNGMSKPAGWLPPSFKDLLESEE